MFCPQFWGRKWLRQFYGRLKKLRSFCRKTSMPIKFLVLGEGILDFFWGGECRFIFMGARIFLKNLFSEFPCISGNPCCLLLQGTPCFCQWASFPFFPKGFGELARCFLGSFPCALRKKTRKEDQGYKETTKKSTNFLGLSPPITPAFQVEISKISPSNQRGCPEYSADFRGTCGPKTLYVCSFVASE